MKINSRKGFTLIECIVVLVIVAVLIGMAVPSVIKNKQNAEDVSMISLARSLNMAKSSYILEVGKSTASANWSGAANDQARYALVSGYLQSPPANLTDYILAGYTVTLNGITDKVQVFRGGTEVTYQ